MKPNDLHTFVGNVLAIDAGYSGMGGAQTGIVGGPSTEVGVIQDLRKNVLAFATEYAKPHPDHARLATAAAALEGSFYTLQTISAASEKRFDWLMDQLDKLMHAAAAQS